MANEFPNIQIKVISQKGTCVCGHKEGDTFLCTSGTPSGLCLSAFAALLPAIQVLRMGGVHPWEADGDAVSFCCPDYKNPVVFEVRRLNPEKCDSRSADRS